MSEEFMTWEDDVEASNPKLIAALEEDILRSKEILSRLSADEDFLF